MTLEQYLNTVSSEERATLVEVWQWSTELLAEADLDHVRETVENECRFPASAWDDLFAALDEAAADVPTTMTRVFRDQTLEGDEIENTPTPKGRALEISRFRSLMRDAGMSPRRRDQIVEDVWNGFMPAIPYSAQLAACDLGNHLIWSTFSEEAETGRDPFRNWTDVDTIRGRLGLQDPQNPDDPEERGLVLLVYRVPSAVNVRYPTVADAYAGSGWNPNFQCSDRGDDWGYTSGDRPEVVHDVIQGKQFVAHPRNSAYAFAPLRIVE
jgi:hypothetical protein